MIRFIRRLFGLGEEPFAQNAVTAPLSEQQLSEITGEKPPVHLAQYIVGSALNIGRRRENNEDALLALQGTLGVDSGGQPFGIFVIADGMGGHRSGELASEAAVRSVGYYLINKIYGPLFGPNPQPSDESLREIMEGCIVEAHNSVRRVAPGGGCTLTAALLVGNQMVVGHLGDSRAYLVERDGRMQVLTKDHTLVNRLQEMGQISAAEAEIHPQKAVLYRALGQGDFVEADVSTNTLPATGAVLLCSDGLWGSVDEDSIEGIVNSATSPHLACQHLVEAANAAGGPDNISVILVRLNQ